MLYGIYRIIRWPWLILIGLFMLILAGRQFTSPDVLRYDDFVEYWAAGRLSLTGGNPYDPEQILRLERGAGRQVEEAVMLWNPPWVLPLLMPFSMLPYPIARVLWFLLHLITLAWSADRLGRMESKSIASRWLPWIIAFTFAPALHAVKAGQITPFMLPGLVGAMSAFPRHPFRAGLWSALLLLKPHLAYLALLTLLAESIRQRRPSFLLGLGVALAGASALAALLNPMVFAQYLHAWHMHPPSEWATATLGGILRLLLGPQRVALQFVPPLIGLGFWLHRIRHRPPSLPELPMWTMLSLATAAYGWTFDLTLAIAGLVPAFLRWPAPPIPLRWLGLILIHGLLDGILLFTSWPQIFYFWAGPAWLIWFLAAQGAGTPTASPQGSDAGGITYAGRQGAAEGSR